MPKIEIYTTKACPYCVRAKQLLQARGVEYQEYLISFDDEQKWNELEIKSGGMQTVPQIYKDGVILGGYTELADLDAQDELKSLKSKAFD